MEKVKNNSSKIIDKEHVSDYETWRIPVVSDFAQGGDQAGDPNSKYLTADKIEQIQKEAYEEAFQQGMQQGISAGQSQIQQQVERLNSVINNLANPLALLDDEVQQELVNLCIALLKQLVRRELKLDPGQVVAVVRDSLSALPLSARKIQVRLNPEDVRLVKDALGESDDGNWSLIDDPVISPGGCKIVTETSQIDATVESRIAQLITQVFGGERESDRNSD